MSTQELNSSEAILERIIVHTINLFEKGYSQQRLILKHQQNNQLSSKNTKQYALDKISQHIRNCEKCSLCKERINTVPGEGVLTPELMIIGEAPGQNEDEQGRPFVGKAGQYLDKWLASIQMSREKNVYITNTVKCRPPNNRNPTPVEVLQCNEYLQTQINILKPKMILALGNVAAHILTGQNNAMAYMRTQKYQYANTPLRATYHPSAVLRNPEQLRQLVWIDLQRIKKELLSLSVS